MKFPNLHIVWKEGENLPLPDLLSRSLMTKHKTNTVLEQLRPQFYYIFMTHNEHTQPLQCHYAVSKEYVDKITTNTTVE